MRGERENAFGFLRFWLAAQVLVAHAWPLGGFGDDPLMRFSSSRASLAQVAACGFFAISGLLVSESRARSSLPRFLWHRFLRIFPGFWACLLVTAFVLAPIEFRHEHGTLAGYFAATSDGPLSYLRHNALLEIHQWRIDSLLAQVPHRDAFDGALWTLLYEFRCYLVTAALGLLGVFTQRRRIGAALALVALAGCIALAHTGPAAWLGSYYAAGAAWFFFRRQVPLHGAIALACVAAGAITLRLGGWFVAGPLCLTYVVMFLAARLTLRRFDARADLSYGVYVYAFPVEQLLAAAAVPRFGLVLYALCAIAITVPIALASWFLVERPALKLKNLGA